MVRDVYRSWNALRSPFATPESFNIELDTDKQDWVAGITTLEKIHEYALFHFACVLKNDSIKKFEYEFKPYPLMKKLRGRKIIHTDQNVRKVLTMKDEDGETINLSTYDIGEITIEGVHF